MVTAAAYGATALGCIGIFVSSTGTAFSSSGAAAFLLGWLVVCAMLGPRAAGLIAARPFLLVFPVLALVSVAWSDAPAASLRGGIQLALTCGFAILAARLLTPRHFVGAVTLSLATGVVLCLLFGRYLPDPFTGTTPYVGIFASKNAMAFFMTLAFVFSFGCLLDRQQPLTIRALGGATVLLALPLLVLAKSAGAFVTTALALAVLFGGALLGATRRGERAVLAVAGVLVALPIALGASVLAVQGTLAEAAAAFVTDILGKDLTLTGRTILWHHAETQIGARPWLGTGYLAFWQHGNPLAEGLWRAFRIQGRSGFHFHNTYLEVAVGLGVTGAAALLALVAATIMGNLRAVLRDGTMARAVLLAATACLFGRSFVEVDFGPPFAMGTFLLFACAAYARR